MGTEYFRQNSSISPSFVPWVGPLIPFLKCYQFTLCTLAQRQRHGSDQQELKVVCDADGILPNVKWT